MVVGAGVVVMALIAGLGGVGRHCIFTLAAGLAHPHTHYNHHRAGLLCDGSQGYGQGAIHARFVQRLGDVGEQHRGVQRERGSVGRWACGNEADNGRRDNAQGGRSGVYFRNAHAVVVASEGHDGAFFVG